MKGLAKRFLRDDSGATAIEYSLIAALLCGILVALWPAFYGDFTGSWVSIGKVISGAVK